MKTQEIQGRERRKRKILAIIAVVLLAGAAVQAGPLITIALEAEVDSVDDPGNLLEGNILVGSIISGTYTYDLLTPDTNPLPYVGDYGHFLSPCGIFLSVGGFDFETDPTKVNFLVEIINDSTSGGLHDSYILRSYNNLPLSNGILVNHISWILRDSTATALSNTELPTTAPILDVWSSNYLSVTGDKLSYFDIGAYVTNAYVVPEPATILLFAIGGAFLRKRKYITSIKS